MEIKGLIALNDLQDVLSMARKYIEEHDLWYQDRVDHFSRFLNEYEESLLDVIKENRMSVLSGVRKEIYETLRQQEVLRVQKELEYFNKNFKGIKVTFWDRIKILLTGVLK